MSVFDSLVGQEPTVSLLRSAAASHASRSPGVEASNVAHAWLFTGPAGSGRSVAALAFAAALQCDTGGCGGCKACRTTLAGSHPDVLRVTPEGLSIGVESMRALVLRASGAPTAGRVQVLLIEDADRLTEAAANALLKAVEEPPSRTVFLLCAPSTHPDDIPLTLRSRCWVVTLVSPSPAAVARVLVDRDAVDATTAELVAHAAQGHVGRARHLALDAEARDRRTAVLGLPRTLSNIGACFAAADVLIAQAEAEAAAWVTEMDSRETAELKQALGAGGSGKGAATASRAANAAGKDLAKRHGVRATRVKRDCLDRALVDLAAFYRDVLMVRLAAGSALTHPDFAEAARAAAARWSAESVLRRIDAVLACREAIAANVTPRIAVESMMLTLFDPTPAVP